MERNFDVNAFKAAFSFQPVGVRTNNLGCLRYNSRNRWHGQLGDYKGYCKFDDMENGVRACVHVLMRYLFQYRLFSITDIISRYAPLTDGNSTNQYSFIVSKLCGLTTLNSEIELLRIELPLVISSIFKVENGAEYIRLANLYNFHEEFVCSIVDKYFNQFLDNVVYPIKGKVNSI